MLFHLVVIFVIHHVDIIFKLLNKLNINTVHNHNHNVQMIINMKFKQIENTVLLIVVQLILIIHKIHNV